MKKKFLFLVSALALLSACGSQNDETSSSSENSSSSSTSSQMDSTTQPESTTSSTQQSSAQTENSQTTSETTSTIRKYSDAEKQAITAQFLTWANEQAKIGGMAVSDNFFTHGASGRGDWYAVTSDGLMQMQQQIDPGYPGYDAFPLHNLGGVIWYYSNFGTTGATNEVNDAAHNPSTATGFSEVADQSQPITKYILGDNGVVYEAKTSSAFSDGFYVAGDDGNLYEYYSADSQLVFQRSQDNAAQAELQRILQEYN